MDRERHSRVMALFDQACALEPDKWESFLHEACGEDYEIRQQVERMLRHDQQATPFVEQADGPSGVEFVASGIAALDDEPALPDRIGQYTIIRKIGEGGMGVVYEATQENPHRAVALKALRLGTATRSLFRRFEFETEVLGRLKHAGIAQIYEAGTTKTAAGVQPYFAMELVQGRELLDYAKTHKLPLRDKLVLFAKICDAVHFAHQVGVIHRDLKPGNILVAESVGSKGEPKILDFGIARATDADIRTVTMQTNVGQLVGTIPYMSPEQVSGDPNAIDTRSDVYALGVILFELLGHCLPHDITHRTIPEAVRIIQDLEPSRLGSVDTSLRGDVETIVAKALEKEKDRRYTSSADLAADVHRFLNNEPISARPASTIYQLRKFARRNTGLVGGITIAFLMLIASVIQVTLERDTARVEAARASALNTFLLDDMFGGIDPYSGGRKDMTVAQLLDNATSHLDDAFAGQPAQESVIRAALGDLYNNLGDKQKAETMMRDALKAQVNNSGSESQDAQETRYMLGSMLIRDGRLDEGGAILKMRLDIQERNLSEDDPDIANTLDELGYLAYIQSRHKEAEMLHRRALAIERQAYGNEHTSVATTLDLLSNTLHGQKRFDEARELHEECLRRWQAEPGDSELNVAVALFKLGVVAMQQGDHDAADEYYSRSLEIRRRIHQPRHPEIAESLAAMCEMKIRRRQLEEAKPICEDVLEIQRATLDTNNTSTAKTLTYLGAIAWRQGDSASAEKWYREAVGIYNTANPKGSAAAVTTFLLARSIAKQDRCAQEIPLLRESLKRGEAVSGKNHGALALAKHQLGHCLFELDQYEEVEELLLAAHAGVVATFGSESERAQKVVSDIVAFYTAQNRLGDAAGWQKRMAK